VQQLHLVGFTTDHRGLIFSVRRGAKSGGYVIRLDESVMTAVEELRALLADEKAEQDDATSSSKRQESSLSVREVQARLRRGRTIEQVAREAGVDATWVSRFAVPVLAEQAEIIRAARATRMTKQRVGLSGAPLGDSVYRNLAERGLADPREELDKAWRAQQLTEGMWLVTLKYSLRGRESEGVWEYDEAAGALRARGRLGTQLGYREPTRRASSASRSSRSATPTARAKKASANAPSTARRSPSRQATKRVATARRAAAARMVSDAEKATRRNAAVARKAATKPVVLPPRRPVEPPPPPEALLIDDYEDEPKGWADELELAWDDAEPEADDDGEQELDAELEPEPEAIIDVDVEVEVEAEPDVEVETEAEAEVEVERAPVDGPARPVRRRAPLRARPAPPAADPASSAERARRQIRLRQAAARLGPADAGNGPVFRSDLAQPVSEAQSFPRSALGPSPAPPLSTPTPPIESPSRRRRRRPLRGR
jgi:hypothetical protein